MTPSYVILLPLVRWTDGRAMRINARLDDERVKKLRQIQSLMGLSASDVVKQALDLLHQQRVARSQGRLDALLSSDLIGCADGPRDLASRYKAYLARGLESKHGTG